MTNEAEIELKELYKKHNKSLGVYIKCHGELAAIDEVTVVVSDECSYKIKGLVNAVDVAFKIIKAFGRAYPAASKPVWEFLGDYAFKLNARYISSQAINLGNQVLRTFQTPISSSTGQHSASINLLAESKPSNKRNREKTVKETSKAKKDKKSKTTSEVV